MTPLEQQGKLSGPDCRITEPKKRRSAILKCSIKNKTKKLLKVGATAVQIALLIVGIGHFRAASKFHSEKTKTDMSAAPTEEHMVTETC